MKSQEINTSDLAKEATLTLSGSDLKNLIMNQTGPGDVVLAKKDADAEAFMNSPMTIMVNQTSDVNEENPVIVGNNGALMGFYRGQPTTCKRKFVDSLCVRSATITTPEMRNAAGEKTFGITVRTALKYPFTVMEDKHKEGPEWLKSKLAGVL